MRGVAVIGAGQWGPNFIRNFHEGRVSQVVWVVDLDQARLEQVRARYPEVRISRELEDALSDDTVDAVVVATPTTTHYPIVRRALERGRHVLVEKPVTTSYRHAAELCELAERRNLVLLVGHVFVYNAAIRRVKQYIGEGELGRIFYISMVRTNLGPIRLDVNAAWDLASHDISIVNHWFEAEPVSVSAVGGNWINQGIQDAVFATLRYPGGQLVNLHASWLNPRKAREITVVGDKRMLTFDDLNIVEPIRIYDKQVIDQRTQAEFIDSISSFRASVREGDIIIPKVTLAEPLKNECAQFIECLELGTRPVTDGRFGACVVRILEAVERSMKNQGREERVHP